MKKERLTRNQIIDEKERLIIENFHRVSKQLGIIVEGSEEKTASDGGYYNAPNVVSYEDGKTYEIYKNEIVKCLNQMDSGDKIVDEVMNGALYSVYMKSAYERGIDACKMASRIRDAWYGV